MLGATSAYGYVTKGTGNTYLHAIMEWVKLYIVSELMTVYMQLVVIYPIAPPHPTSIHYNYDNQ